MGRLLSVTGSGSHSAPTYVSAFAYRAWGAVKDFNYGNGAQQHLDYNARLQGAGLALSHLNPAGLPNGTVAWTYDYYADGQLRQVNDLSDPHYDRRFDYDHVGRLTEARTGSEARGGATAAGPFRQTYSYDVWENTTAHTPRVDAWHRYRELEL
jgi:hypothetical protein